ncbi:MAG: LegC family aminotransferase, partial [Candidatus Marinimicrobia bacterium]|nr:LegC family aminotransferase [Candidatus Neomarinimicrobiota bacterium]
MTQPFQELVSFVKSLYPGLEPVPLHAPVFHGNEKEYMLDCIDTTFVSYVGKYVTEFESMTAQYTGAKHAVAFVNGTAALHIALEVAGVEPGDEVITQSLTFVATANAIAHSGAEPVFVDVDRDTLGMSPFALSKWLETNVLVDEKSKKAKNRTTGCTISAIVPMHTFGNPCRIDEIVEIANKFNIPVIEDSAESLGSTYKHQHTGTFGLAGILSYNGNKTITTGGGGMIITNDDALAARARHLSTTAKIPHRWEFSHDETGYNYRLNNVSASIGVAQMEKLDDYLLNKRETAKAYATFCQEQGFDFVRGLNEAKTNNWLNAIILEDRAMRDEFLAYTN